MTIYNQGVPNQDSLVRSHLCENHAGISPAVWKEIVREQNKLHLYPDPDCRQLREEIARFHRIDSDMITVANGTDEIILMTALAFLNPDIQSIVSAASFPGYHTASKTCRAQIRTVPLNHYAVPWKEMSALCRKKQSVAFVCNPHNPTGTLLSAEAIEELTARAAESESLPVFDEAYGDFAGSTFVSAIPLIQAGKRALVTRTFSKAYGLAGFRIGYAIGRPEDIRRIQLAHSTVPFAVNRLAQTAALHALRDQAFLSRVVQQNSQIRAKFCKEMDRIGVDYIPSYTNFVLLRLKQGTTATSSSTFVSRLHSQFGILARDAGLFGLHSHARVSMVDDDNLPNLCRAIETLQGTL